MVMIVDDSRAMLHHYKKIYNAKPSPEISRTRASSAGADGSRRAWRPQTGSSGAPLSRCSSFQSVHHSNGLDDSEFMMPNQPYNAYRRGPDQSMMRRVWSSLDVREESSSANSRPTAQPNSSNGSNLSDRISSFLAAVRLQEEKNRQKRLMQQKRMPRRTSIISSSVASVVPSGRVSTISMCSSNRSNPILRVANKKNTPVSPANSAALTPTTRAPGSTTTTPTRFRTVVLDGRKVASKLRQDRNYQPPRRRVIGPLQVQQSKENSNVRQSDLHHHDALDLGNEADEDEEVVGGRQKQDWLYDQARRVRARQKAALLIKLEKDSSQDSAYGFSGCETSRMNTREPTPVSLAAKRVPVSHHVHVEQMKNSRLKLHENVHFLAKVTDDIVKKGAFTDQAIRRVLESHVAKLNLDHKLTEFQVNDLFRRLKLQLGLSSTSTDLRHILGEQGTPRLRSSEPKKSSTSRQPQFTESDRSMITKLLQDETDLEDSIVDDIIDAAIKPAMILRPRPMSAKASAPKTTEKVTSTASKGKGLMDQLNISNLNVSFNSSCTAHLLSQHQSKKREQFDQEKAMLIKSFALHGRDRGSGKTRSSTPPQRPKEDDTTPRSSSMLYQTDDEESVSSYQSQEPQEVTENHSIQGASDSDTVEEEIGEQIGS